MGFFDDFLNVTKDVAKGAGRAAKKTADLLVDEDAWADTARAVADGPGGRKVRAADLANIALDSTMVIPGAGLVGGAARVAARQSAKNTAEMMARRIAQKEAKDKLRSPANLAIRKKVGDSRDEMLSKVLTRGGGKRAGEAGARKGGAGGARKTAKDPLSTQRGRLAAKQKAGVGTKVGFGQTRKRTLRNAALTAGANAAVGTYDRIFDPQDKGEPEERPQYDPGTRDYFGGMRPGGIMGMGGGMYLIGADGSQMQIPSDLAELLAQYANRNNSVAGTQVVSLQ